MSKYRILVVEDSKVTGRLLVMHLKKNLQDSYINWTKSLLETKRELQENSYDYIILDVHLPDGEGPTIIPWSAKIKGFNGKFFIFTASEDANLREKLYTQGVIDFILKSGDIKTIVAEIAIAIEQVDQYSDYTILVVDDGFVFRNMLKNIFISRNYQVITAKDGAEALNIVNNSKIDVILMDLNMPNMSGDEFLVHRRKQPAIFQIPTIIITAENEAGLISKLLKLGASDVIHKPFIVEEIVMKVDNFIRTVIFQSEKDSLTHELEKNVNKLNEINQKLSKYLSPQLHSSIFEDKELGVISKRKKLTIMFSDIQNFTETTEEMEPEDLTYILNNYLTEMSNIALKYGATIDKFIGDAIVAFFGDPESMGVKEDAVACVLMAIEMKNKLKELQHKWHTEGFVRPFSARIGINTGYVTVGNFGSEQKMEYTAIGGNMNLAARLEASATAGEILISHETYLLVRDKILTTYMGDVKAKGINKPIRTYQVIQAENRNSLSAKSDGFFINIDYAAIKDGEKENIVEVLDSVKRSLLNSQETYFDESSHHDEITKVSINVYDEDYEDSISKPLIVESKSKVERIPANEETKQEKVEFNNDLKESESKEEEPHHNLKEPESKVERILPNESEENKE